MLRGSCLCGGVAFEIHAPPRWSHFCHCSRCRKSSGSAFTAPLLVPTGALRFTAGADRVRRYGLPDTQYANYFCTTCGSSVPAPQPIEGLPFRAVPLGTLDDDPQCPPRGHIYVGSKASWYAITDALPQFEEMPSPEAWAELLREVPGDAG